MSRGFPRTSFVSVLAVVLITGFAGSVSIAHAATFTVNTFTDAVDLDTGGTFDGVCDADAAVGVQCTLRAAIQEANAQGGPDIIDIPAGTYTTTIGPPTFENFAVDGDLDIREDLTIQRTGSGAVVVDGGDIEGVFQVVSGLDIDATFRDIVITNGFNTGFAAGGGIRDGSTGTLTLERVTITDNEAMGAGGLVDVSGTLIMTDTTVSGNRTTGGGNTGGISLNSVTATVTNSTVSGNHTVGAAGVNGGGFSVVSATLTLTNSTVSGNNVTGSGGGVFHNFATTVALINSTVTGNTADSDAGADDGGGIAPGGNATGTPSLRNSILHGNLDVSGGAPDCSGAINSLGYNLIGDDTGCIFTLANDLVGADPVLGPLQDNGGPTETHALQTGSAAIDAAAPTGCTGGSTQLPTDQRRFSRHADGDANGTVRCDIGAFELQGPMLTVSVTGSGIVTGPGISCPGDCTEPIVEGASLSLTETPTPGGTFEGWGDDCSAAGKATNCNLEVGTQDLSVTAAFAKAAKALGLSAKPRRVDAGRRTTLTASITPCNPSTRNDRVEFRKGQKLLGVKAVDEACSARMKRRVRKRSSFTAFSPEDGDSLAATSSKVTVRIRAG